MMGRLVRKGISPAIAAIIIVSIAIAVCIVAGAILMSQTRSMASKGATLQLTVDAHDVGNGFTALTIMVKNTGPEDVRITRIEVYTGSQLRCYWNLNNAIKAGGSASFAYVCQTYASVGGKLAVRVLGVTMRTGMPIQASTSVEILP